MSSQPFYTIQPGEPPAQKLEKLRARLGYGLPHTLGLEVLELGEGWLVMQMAIEEKHLAVNGYLHAGSVVTLADTCCGFGCASHLPPGAVNFTTIELKSNFLGTATRGRLRSDAELRHRGRSTQVWDATVRAVTVEGEMGRTIALFRCTQMILYPPS